MFGISILFDTFANKLIRELEFKWGSTHERKCLENKFQKMI